MIKIILQGRKKSDAYLATDRRHRWSAQVTMKMKKIIKMELSASTVAFISWIYLSRFSFYINIRQFNITLAINNTSNIKTLIRKYFKDKEFPNKKFGIYNIDCKDCDKVYFGQTNRNLDTHMKKHFTHKSTVADHVWEEVHSIEEVKLLKHIQKLSELII